MEAKDYRNMHLSSIVLYSFNNTCSLVNCVIAYYSFNCCGRSKLHSFVAVTGVKLHSFVAVAGVRSKLCALL